MRYKQRQFGAERSINVLYEDFDADSTETQEWRLQTISIGSDLRERLDIKRIDETKIIGYVDVDPDSLEWEFTPAEVN
jgi:hypothetical protein